MKGFIDLDILNIHIGKGGNWISLFTIETHKHLSSLLHIEKSQGKWLIDILFLRGLYYKE